MTSRISDRKQILYIMIIQPMSSRQKVAPPFSKSQTVKEGNIIYMKHGYTIVIGIIGIRRERKIISVK